jgi:hypothetical protein
LIAAFYLMAGLALMAMDARHSHKSKKWLAHSSQTAGEFLNGR